MNLPKIENFVIWTLGCAVGFFALIFLTQYGEPVSEGVRRFKNWSGFAVFLGVPALWIFGCWRILRDKAR